MRQSRFPLAFLLVILSASIVTTGIIVHGWFGTRTKSTSANSYVPTPSSPAPTTPSPTTPSPTTCSFCSWQKIGNDIDGEERFDGSGSAVSLSSDGKTVAVGAIWNGLGNGHVRIFQWIESTSNWTQMGEDIDGEATNDISGSSVSLSSDGNIVAIGAPWNDGNGTKSGHVRIFQWIESTSSWTQMGEDIDGERSGDRSGSSVSLSTDGNIVAIGAPYNTGIVYHSGHARIFQWTESTSSWTQMGADINGEAGRDESGSSVSLSSDGNIVAIGAPGSYKESGHARIFQWTESTFTWTQMGADIDGEAEHDAGSGLSVSLSSDGKIVAIGAQRNDGNGMWSGHVRIFQWTESTFTWTQMGTDIDGEASFDESGSSVSLSSDGNIVAIGAPYNDGNGYRSGHARIFLWTESTSSWTQMGADIDGEAKYDYSGSSVSLSSDGKIVAIGAPYNDGNNGTDICYSGGPTTADACNSGHVRIFQWIEL
jgi:hypothetical protein